MSDPLLIPFEKERIPTTFYHEYWRQPLPGTGGDNAELEVQYEDWRKEKILGSGTYGTVRLVRSARDEQRVRAVKEVFKVNTPTAIASQELKALIELKKHPDHFVQFLGWWEDDDCFYFAMEYIEQGDLKSLLQREKLTEMDAQTIARQLLEGLKIMHLNEICHRDIKPDNVLAVSSSPGFFRVKLADFGCAKFAVGTKLRTTTGTDGYMAPEVSGYLDDQETSVYSFKADMWSLGCLIFYVLTTKLPLIGYGNCMKYIRGKTPLPRENLIQNNVGPSGIDFISKLMTPDQEKRPSASIALCHEWLIINEEQVLDTVVKSLSLSEAQSPLTFNSPKSGPRIILPLRAHRSRLRRGPYKQSLFELPSVMTKTGSNPTIKPQSSSCPASHHTHELDDFWLFPNCGMMYGHVDHRGRRGAIFPRVQFRKDRLPSVTGEPWYL